jgi:hypothetical protein
MFTFDTDASEGWLGEKVITGVEIGDFRGNGAGHIDHVEQFH